MRKRRKLLKLAAALLLLVVLFSLFAGSAWADKKQDKEKPPEKDTGGMFERIVAGIVNVPTSVIEGLCRWWGGFKTLDKLVFMQGYSEDQKKNLPWEANEPEYVRLWYEALAAVATPFVIIIVAVSAFQLLASAANPAARTEAMETFQRAVIGVILIALMPILVSTLMRICAAFVDGIGKAFNEVAKAAGMGRSIADWGAADLVGVKIVTGSVLGTALVRLFMTAIFVYLNVIYMVRKVAMTVFYCFTPIAVIIWIINKRSVVMPVLLGELASNAFMNVAHALVLCTILLFCDVKAMGTGNWVTILVSLYTLIPLAETLRNSLQSVIARFMGFNEAGTAAKVFGAAAGLGGLFSIARVGSSLFGNGAPSPTGGKLPPDGGKLGGLNPRPAISPGPGGPAASGGAAASALSPSPTGMGGSPVALAGGASAPPGAVAMAPTGGAQPPSGGVTAAPAGGASAPPAQQGVLSGLAGRAQAFVASRPRLAAAVRFGSTVGKAAAVGVGALASLAMGAVPGGGKLAKATAATAKYVYGGASTAAYLAGGYAKDRAVAKLQQAAQKGSVPAQKVLQAGRAVQAYGQRAAQRLTGQGAPPASSPAPSPAGGAQARQIGFRPPTQGQPQPSLQPQPVKAAPKYPNTIPRLS
ncbi:MAG: hypothetical protein ACPLTR_07255 [Thermacetogeniaceae bacterium]